MNIDRYMTTQLNIDKLIRSVLDLNVIFINNSAWIYIFQSRKLCRILSVLKHSPKLSLDSNITNTNNANKHL